MGKRRWRLTTAAAMLALVASLPSAAQTPEDGESEWAFTGNIQLVVTPHYVGLAENGIPPTAAEVAGAGIVTIGGTGNSLEAVWTSDPSGIVETGTGEQLTARWAGTLTPNETDVARSYLGLAETLASPTSPSADYDYTCTVEAERPTVTSTYVWGYGVHRCTGDAVVKFRVETVLQAKHFEWESRTGRTSSWVYPPVVSVGRSVTYSPCSSQSGANNKWRTKVWGRVYLTGGYSPGAGVEISSTATGPCF